VLKRCRGPAEVIVIVQMQWWCRGGSAEVPKVKCFSSSGDCAGGDDRRMKSRFKECAEELRRCIGAIIEMLSCRCRGFAQVIVHVLSCKCQLCHVSWEGQIYP